MAVNTYKVGKVAIMDVAIGYCRSGTLSINQDIEDVSAIGSTWHTKAALGKSWSVSVELQYESTNALQAEMRTELIGGDGETTGLRFYEDGTKYFAGTAMLTSWTQGKSVDGVDTVSASWEGSGALTYN